jgi:hypothetical protein
VRFPLRLDRFLEGFRLRRLVEIGADMRQPGRLDRRADVVEDDRLRERRLQGAEDMDDQPAARGADEGRLGDAERGQPGQYVARLDGQGVVAGIVVVLRQTAAAIVEGDDLPRRFRVARQIKRQFVEIARIAGQARQADRRPATRHGLAVDPRVQPQAVARLMEEIRKPVLRGHRRPSTRSPTMSNLPEIRIL